MLKAIPVIILLTVAVGLGLWAGVLYLRGIRKPVLIGLHFLVGAGGLETLVMVLRGTPDGTALRIGSFGAIAAGILAATMFSGLMAPLFIPRSPRTANIVLATHAIIGVMGFILFLVWLTSLGPA